MVILFISLIFAVGCAHQQQKPETPSIEKTSPSEIKQASAREDFGCSPPPTCALMKDQFAKQFCEDWKAGKDVWSTIPDCSYMTTEGCRKLCEEKTKGRTSQMPGMPSGQMPAGTPNMPSMGDFPNPSDFPDMDEMMKSMQKGMPSMPTQGSIFPSRPPVCVDAADYHAQLMYVRPSDAKDRYDEKAPILRKWLANGNGVLNNEAKNFGLTADLKVACKDNEILVLNVVLQRSSSKTDSFVNELKSKGFTDDKTKYIVWYDGVVVGCGGSSSGKCTATASLQPSSDLDDRLAEDNAFNTGGQFAMLFAIEDETTGPARMLHEYGHIMGAVQNSASHSTGEGHCKDEPPIDKGGTDIMCKSDNPSTTFSDSCKGYQFRFDCNNDDYFNPKPEAGSYLATHWNLGSSLNRFIQFGESTGTISKGGPSQEDYPGVPGYPMPSGFPDFPGGSP